MIKVLIIFMLIFFGINGITQPNEFSFIPTNSSMVFLGQAKIYFVPAEFGDWVAAFDEDGNCAGASQVIIFNTIAYISLQIYGDDPTTPNQDEGMNSGESFILKIWDATENQITSYPNNPNPEAFEGWTNTNGTPIPQYPVTVVYNFIPDVALRIDFSEIQGWVENNENYILVAISNIDGLEKLILEREETPHHFEVIQEEHIAQLPNYNDKFLFKDSQNEHFTNYYRIKGVFKNGLILSSKIIAITNHEIDLKFKIYPIPANDYIQIDFNPFPQEIQLTIYDLYMFPVFTTNNINSEGHKILNISFLPSGKYIVLITSDNMVLGKRKITKI